MTWPIPLVKPWRGMTIRNISTCGRGFTCTSSRLQQEHPSIVIEEVQDAVPFYDEILKYRRFLDDREVMNTTVPQARDNGAIRSGRSRRTASLPNSQLRRFSERLQWNFVCQRQIAFTSTGFHQLLYILPKKPSPVPRMLL